MAESEEPKSFLIKVKEELKSWLKIQHLENKDHGLWSHHFMANKGKTMETVINFIIDSNGTKNLTDVQAGFRKGRGIRYKIANICWIIEKAREFQKKKKNLPLFH